MSTINKLTPEAKEQRTQLEQELSHAGFEGEENGNRKYKNLDTHVLPLLRILGFQVSRVFTLLGLSLMICVQDWGYTLWRLSTGITINNDTGSVYLIPIRTVSGSPQIEPGGPLKPGDQAYVDNGVKLQPELDCLFIVRKKNQQARRD